MISNGVKELEIPGPPREMRKALSNGVKIRGPRKQKIMADMADITIFWLVYLRFYRTQMSDRNASKKAAFWLLTFYFIRFILFK